MEANQKSRDRSKTAKQLKIAAIAALILTVAILATVFSVALLNEEGIIIRNKTVRKSEDLSINGAMFTYIFWDNFRLSITGDYAYYYKLQGISSADDLYLENPNEKGKTWWDHFAEMAEETTTALLCYAQYALDNGKGLTAEDELLIKEEMSNMEDTAEVLGMTFEDYLSVFAEYDFFHLYFVLSVRFYFCLRHRAFHHFVMLSLYPLFRDDISVPSPKAESSLRRR